MIQQTIETCRKLVTNPVARKEYLLLQKHKKQGIVGCFSNYIPEEILAAAGFHPLRMIGRFSNSTPNRKPLFNPVCSFVQDVYASAAAGEFDFLSSVIFPNSCDSLKVLQQIWDYEKISPSTYALLHPVNTDLASVQYFATQLKAMGDYLMSNGGVTFSESDLKQIVEKYNQTRYLLRRLYEVRNDHSGFLSGSDIVTLMTAGLIMERDEYNRILNDIVDQSSVDKKSSKQSKKIMLMGPLVDNLQLLQKIEQFGAAIIHEDITNGARYCDLDIQTEGDLYANLAYRYLHAAPSPTLNSDQRQGQIAFEKRIDDLKPDGVIYINQKFCEPHVHRYLGCIDLLRKMNINILMLEIEHDQQTVSDRDMLRVESFLEIAGGS